MTADFEELARAGEIHLHAQVEIRLGFAAHHGGEVKHGVGIIADRAGEHIALADVTDDALYPRVIQLRGRGLIQQGDALKALRLPVRTHEAAPLQQPVRQASAEKAGAAGDEDLHGYRCTSSPVTLGENRIARPAAKGYSRHIRAMGALGRPSCCALYP